MFSKDIDYFEKRASDERNLANAATDDHVRAIHLEFAARYDEAAHRLKDRNEIRSSREAISSSLGLLKATSHQVRSYAD